MVVKKLITFTFLLVFPIVIFSQTKIKSFYFDNNQSIPTPNSQQQLDLFKKSIINKEIVVLKVYSYIDSLESNSSNNVLAESRLFHIVGQLNLRNDSLIELKPFALNYKYDDKDAQSWRRVDVYYDDLVKIEKSLDKKIKIEEKPLLILNNPIETALEDSLPFILNISFIEGTSKIESKSFVEIKKLANYLNSHQNSYTILIRGHVCCGKNMRISRNRAKAVYKELLKLGVEKSRLAYIGMSNKEPLVYPEKTNADRQKNRRVDIIFNTTSNQ